MGLLPCASPSPVAPELISELGIFLLSHPIIPPFPLCDLWGTVRLKKKKKIDFFFPKAREGFCWLKCPFPASSHRGRGETAAGCGRGNAAGPPIVGDFFRTKGNDFLRLPKKENQGQLPCKEVSLKIICDGKVVGKFSSDASKLLFDFDGNKRKFSRRVSSTVQTCKIFFFGKRNSKFCEIWLYICIFFC